MLQGLHPHNGGEGKSDRKREDAPGRVEAHFVRRLRIARDVLPHEVIDRPKGYFPVPALTHLEGPYLDLVRDALYAPVAKERGLFSPEAVDALLADPNGRLTPLRGNELWQIALLELWLQKHDITGPAA